MIKAFLIFLVINFSALAIGGFFTGEGANSDWYNQLNQAPWTPPGWVFGFAWTTIMLLFSIYLTRLWLLVDAKAKLIALFSLQFVLNVGWNPVFFGFHLALPGLLIICALTVLIAYILITYLSILKNYTLILLPYFIWLCIATSLNAYIVFNN